MRSFLLLLAAGIAAGSFNSCQPGQQHTYEYESQILTDVPHFATQVSGFKLKSQVTCRCESNGKIQMKMQGIQIKKTNSDMSGPWPESGLLPESHFQDWESAIQQEFIDQMSKPFEITMESGRVEEVYVDPEEPIWSVNIKKGLITMLQVRISDSEREGDDYRDGYRSGDMSGAWKSQWSEGDRSEDQDLFDQEDFFGLNTGSIHRVMETDISGMCETVYGVSEDQQHGDNMKVQKVKNFDRCDKSLAYEQGLLSGLTISPMEHETKSMIERSSHADYQLSGQRGQFTVKSARQDSRFIFTPTSLERGSAVTTVIQLLNLVSSESGSRSQHQDASLQKCKNGLMYTFPKNPLSKPSEYMLGGDSPSRGIRELTETNKREIDSVLSDMVQNIHPEMREQAVQKVQQLSDLIRPLSAEDILEVCQQYEISQQEGSTPSEKSRKREALFDMLPTINSPELIKVLAKLIVQKKVSETRAIVSLKTMTMMITPDVTTAQEYLMPSSEQFLSHPTLKENKKLRVAAITSAAGMMRRLVQQTENQGLSKRKIVNKLGSFMDELKAELRSASTEQEKMGLIMAIGATGCSSAISPLSEVAMDKSNGPNPRVFAAQSLEKMPRSSSKRVQKILAAVYMDMTDVPEVRLSAFAGLMQQHPSYDILNLVTCVQRKERSTNVGSFVYSYMSTLARAELPGMRNMSSNIRRILPLVRPIAADRLQGSKAAHMDYFTRDAHWGIGAEIYKIQAQSQGMQSGIDSRIMANIFGKTFTPIRMAMLAKGVTPVLSKLFGVHSNIQDDIFSDKTFSEVMTHLLTPLKDGSVDFGQVAEDIKKITDDIEISERPEMEKLKLSVFLQVLTEPLGLVQVTSDDILRWIQTGNFPIIGEISKLVETVSRGQKYIDMMKVINLGTSTLQLPTPCGMPVSLNLTAAVITHMTGNIQADIPSSLRDIKTNGISVTANIKPSFALEMRADFGVSCGLMQSSVVVEGVADGKLSTIIKARYNPESKKISLSSEMPGTDMDQFKVELKPSVQMVTLTPRRKMSAQKTYQVTPLSHPTRLEIVQAVVPSQWSVLNAEISETFQVPVSVPNWMSNTWIWSPASYKVTAKAIRSSQSAVMQCDVSIAKDEESVRRLIPSESRLHPGMSDPRGVQIKFQVSPKNDQQNKANLDITIISSSDMKKYQVNVISALPQSSQLVVSAFVDGHALSEDSLRQMSPSTEVAQLSMQLGSHQAKVQLFPDGNQPFSWNQFSKNSFMKMLEMWTGERISTHVVSPVTRHPPTLQYKIKMDSNIDASQWLQSEYHQIATVVVSTYLYKSLPWTPNFFVGPAQSTPSSIEGQLKVIPSFQKCLIHVTTPQGMEYDMSLPISLYTPVSQLISLEKSTPSASQSSQISGLSFNYFKGTFSGSCVMKENSDDQNSEGTTVTTFDSETYKLGSLPNQCEVLLAKDCSRQSLYTVTSTHNGEKKSIKILVPRHKIEIIPASHYLSSDSITVKVDGSEISLSDGESYRVQDRNGYSRAPVAIIEKTGSWIKVLAGDKSGFSLATNGKQVEIQSTRALSGQLCGLCGNYDGEKMNEFEGPDRYINPSAQSMIAKYIVPNSYCDASSVRSHFGISEIVTSTCNPQRRTVVKHRGDQTCFSTRAVEQCPKSCSPAPGQSNTEMIPFECRNANNQKTIRMVHNAKERVLSELENNRDRTIDLPVTIPRECLRRDQGHDLW